MNIQPAEGEILLKSVKDIISNHRSRINELVAFDYRYDEKTGWYQFHIFPNVNEGRKMFAPTNEKFCLHVEQVFKKALGSDAEVSADFEDSATTRFRDSSGKLSDMQCTYPVPYLWVCVERIPGNMISPDTMLERLAEALLEGAAVVAGS